MEVDYPTFKCVIARGWLSKKKFISRISLFYQISTYRSLMFYWGNLDHNWVTRRLLCLWVWCVWGRGGWVHSTFEKDWTSFPPLSQINITDLASLYVKGRSPLETRLILTWEPPLGCLDKVKLHLYKWYTCIFELNVFWKYILNIYFMNVIPFHC